MWFQSDIIFFIAFLYIFVSEFITNKNSILKKKSGFSSKDIFFYSYVFW